MRRDQSISRAFDRDLTPEMLREQTERVAAPLQATRVGTESVVVFRIVREWLALSTRAFQEVVDPAVVHRIPHRSNPVLSGIVNVRGELVPCVSLGALLGVEPGHSRAGETVTRPRLLVFGRDGERFALPVDEAMGVLRYDPAELQEKPSTLAGAVGTYTTGVLVRDGRAIGCLDADLVHYSLNRALT